MLQPAYTIAVVTVLLTSPSALAQAEPKGSRAKGRYFDIWLDFEAPSFAHKAARLADKAWVAAATLRGIAPREPEKRPRIVLRLDYAAHCAEVKREQRELKEQLRKTLGGKNTDFLDRVLNVHTTLTESFVYLEPPRLNAEEYERLGLHGVAASEILTCAAAHALTGHGLHARSEALWLQHGPQAWVQAEMLGLHGQSARARDPHLAGEQHHAAGALHKGFFPSAHALMSYSFERDGFRGEHLSAAEEFFFLLMKRHPKATLDFLRNLPTGKHLGSDKYLDNKKAAEAILAALPEGVDLEAEYKAHFEALRPEWRWQPYYPGPRDRLVVLAVDLPERVPGKNRVTRMELIGSTDYEVTGKVSILDRRNKVAAFELHETALEALSTGVSVAFWLDGRVEVLEGEDVYQRKKVVKSGKTPGWRIGEAQPFSIRVRNRRQVTVRVAGHKVVECESPRHLCGVWGVMAPLHSGSVWYDLAWLDLKEVLGLLRDLAHKDKAAAATQALAAKGPALLPLLTRRLKKSAYLEGKTPDPLLAVIGDLGHRTDDCVTMVLEYLSKCNAAQRLAAFDVLTELAPFAQRPLREKIVKNPLLTGPPPPATSKVAWLSTRFELEKRLTVDTSADISDLIAIVQQDTVFTRDVAATALERHGSKAVSAVPALLKNMKSPKSLGKGARDFQVDGETVTLRDDYYAHCQRALLAIAPDDPRIYRVYTDRLRSHPVITERVNAAIKLGEFGTRAPKAVSVMIKLLSERTEEPVLVATIQAMALMGKPARRALRRLRKLSRSKSASVQRAASEAVRVLAGIR